ncbi:MAG: sigma-54 dependent transcriptional regulator [Deferribacteraceae bacterium]|jgi:DNA-binding NtrC family response regulator|nr:sigma-54 dependent transcriptional regulator [Deferribacteraceae bacterium]
MGLLHKASVMKDEPILVAGTRLEVIEQLTLILQEEFPHVWTVKEEECLRLIEENRFALVVLEASSLKSSTELILKIKSFSPKLQVIVAADRTDAPTVVEFMRSGAYDLLELPDAKSHLNISAVRGIERSMLLDALEVAVSHYGSPKFFKPDAFSHIVTINPDMYSIFRYLEEISISMQPVLISGETGSGKELFAQAIHKLSGRSPFITVNIAGVDDTVFSDTLFGHTKGAFTGAIAERKGILTKAKGGVLLLDEIGELPEQSQIKLLRLIQENTYYPLGSDTSATMDVKLILATNKDLLYEVNQGTFRKDLYYRIHTHSVTIPPLRERLDDIPSLLIHFVKKASAAMGKTPPGISPELVAYLSRYSYPGNVRELEAMVNDAVATHKRGSLALTQFRKYIGKAAPKSKENPISRLTVGGFPTLKEAEDYIIAKAMEKGGGNQKKAAALLGISRQALNKRLLNKNRVEK